MTRHECLFWLADSVQADVLERSRDIGFMRRVHGEPRPDHPTEAQGWDDADAIARAVHVNAETERLEVLT